MGEGGGGVWVGLPGGEIGKGGGVWVEGPKGQPTTPYPDKIPNPGAFGSFDEMGDTETMVTVDPGNSILVQSPSRGTGSW